ncbi:MAG: hypothetical protein HY738_16110 [Bacteroidia bacterium]|nr:hypothetical protein [Bacteroidia bacterium]
MKKFIVFFIFLFGGFSFQLFLCSAQDNQSGRNINEIKKQYPVEMYFIPAGITDDEHAQKIEQFIMTDKNIGYCEIHKDMKSKIFALKEIDSEYINNLLAQKGVSILNNYIHVIDNYFLEGKDPSWKPKSFPKTINTGDQKEDERRFADEIQQWKNTHPMEWQKMIDDKEKRAIK